MSGPPKIKTLMCIDDEQFDQMLYKRVVARSGLVENFITFNLAADALAFLRKTDRVKVDVILLDINMPGMDGFEFLEHASKEFGAEFSKHVIIMLTTSINPRDEQRAKSIDVVKGLVSKPLGADKLQYIVDLATQA
jgi:CheY-like chemotaxis protein